MKHFPAIGRLPVITLLTAGLLPGCMPPADGDRGETEEDRAVEVTSAEVSDPFYSVVEHLDVGGVLLTYVDLEDDIASLARSLNNLLAGLQEHASPIPPIPIDVEAIVRRAHLDGLRAVGLSSARNDGLFLNSGFLYLPEGREGVFRAFGGDPAEFAGLAYAPADTAFFYEIDYDAPALLDTIRDVAEIVMGDAGPNTVDSWLQQPIDDTGITPGELIEALHGRLSAAVVLDPENRLQIPDHDATFADADVIVRIENIASVLQKLLGDEGPFTRTEEDNRITIEATESFPPPFDGKRPILILEDGHAYFSFSRDFLDASRNLEGETLAGRDDFDALVTSLGGPEGNGLVFVRPAVFEEIRRTIAESAAADPEVASVVALVERWLPNPDRPVASLRRNLDNGILVKSEWPASHKQTILSGTYLNPFSVGLLAAMAIPAYSRVQETSMEQFVDNDARQLAAAAHQYFLENGIQEVSVDYDPDTGAISGPLSDYVSSLQPGYTTFPESFTTTEGFTLAHPTLRHPRRYNTEGQYLGEPQD